MFKFELKEKIDMVEDLIFSGDFNEVFTIILDIVEHIEASKEYKGENFEELWKEILKYLMISLENKDYLLVSDILKYELKPIFNDLVEENEYEHI